MNKTLKLALSAVLTAGIILPVIAQDNFPDVPDNHWAYEALARLKKDGLLVGYPDGLFRGNRPASRYELAVAIHATYVHLKSITDGLQAEIDQLKTNAADIQSLKDAVAQLQDEVNGMKGWGADIDNLKKLADQFQKELASLGVDVEGLKKDLADLSRRVGVLEAHRLPFDIHGDASFYLIGGSSSGREIGITQDGRPVGGREVGVSSLTNQRYIVGTGGGTGGVVLKPVGFDVDSTIYHELTLKLTSNNDTGPKWHGDVVIGDMLGDGISSTFGTSVFTTGGGVAGGAAYTTQGMPTIGRPFAVATESVYIQDLAVDFDTSIAGQGLAAELGRTGYEVDPYIYKRPDVLPYFTNDRWGDGKWYFDGGILGFHWSGVRLDIFGGKNDQTTTTNGVTYQTMAVGAVGHPFTPGVTSRPVGEANFAARYGIVTDEQLGLNVNFPLGPNGKIDLAYIWFESNSGNNWNGTNPNNYGSATRAAVYGGNLDYNLTPMFKLSGGYSASDLFQGSHDYTSKDNFAWHAQLSYDAARWGATVGYKQVEPQFGAPGDWGRIGIWWNPTDIQGPYASIHARLTDQLHLKLSGEWYNGTNTTFNTPTGSGAMGTGLGNNDHVYDYKAELGYKLNDAWDFMVGLEYVDWHFASSANVANAANPYESWYNFGLGYNLSDQARLSFLYQYSSYDGKGINSLLSTNKFAGNLISSQLTVKF